MENFPELKEGQVALLRADYNTGIVLDEEYKYATKDTQKAFTVFDDLETAIDFAKRIIAERKDIECGIYRKENECLYFIDRDKIKT